MARTDITADENHSRTFSDNSTLFLGRFKREDRYAEEDLKASKRTSKRLRDRGMPFLRHAGCVWIDVPGAREWHLNRVQRLNQRRGVRHARASNR